ncbi:xanthine dehydrogenase YagR molybdenum-binding subunit [Nannocystis exedens]|uniref:Xanthine dehydrogenase YagR molybdenum-binding subunit n=1 Tax=Nannocystis exedens TaxID=54 RepID=A0A1I2F1L0_9BACT|nr:xanthine dehydrogenase family protein molybdopterin-binding subunit [Nannocystis exedens]PCC69594.1 xanthine dehydrogenase molybdenum-binding subunit YagR [Nannocystis exedens]SFE98909.1 xanthine dehydrogenase YagR molybdenum-binding subunit [Nannocystis exedens]
MSTTSPRIGGFADRIDARSKVTGQARYAADVVLPGLAHAALVGSTIASGRVLGVDTARAEQAGGVLLVLTHLNRGPLGDLPNGDGDGLTADPRPPLADDRVHYRGQIVAMVVAESPEEAAHAASLVDVRYEPAPFVVDIDDADATRLADAPRRGDCAAALRAAPVTLDVVYSTPIQHPCPLEPHAAVAHWVDHDLVVHDTTQWVRGDQAVLARAFGLPRERVRVHAPFVGGSFGAKVFTAAHVLLAAVAARRLQRPVKAVLRSSEVLTAVGPRAATRQRIQLAAERDGRLLALRHHTRSHCATDRGVADLDPFYEPTSGVTRMLYACPHYEAVHDVVPLHLAKPGWMRAPGEATGLWALEGALDELACALHLDPLALRLRNHSSRDAHTGKPHASEHLRECYEQGAERFGWARRDLRPRSMRDGDAWLGWGMATATYPGNRDPASVSVRLDRERGRIHATVSTAGADLGTGMYTMLAVVVADALDLPLEWITVELGDTRLPPCPVTGGSNLTASTAPAARAACVQLRRRLLAFRRAPDESADWHELLSRAGLDQVEAVGTTDAVHDDARAHHSFGAVFVEVRVAPELGRIRVTRVVGVYDVGQVVDATTTRSQLIGGIVFGIGQALLEQLVHDPMHGLPVHADLAGYLLPTHADVPEIDVDWLEDVPDLAFNTIGCRGVGEIGITGVAPAIASAVHHAIGVRLRDLPLTPDRLLAALADASARPERAK